MGLVELPGYVVCILMIEKLVQLYWNMIVLLVVSFRYGRKVLLVVTLLLSGIACLVSGAIQWSDQCKYWEHHIA